MKNRLFARLIPILDRQNRSKSVEELPIKGNNIVDTKERFERALGMVPVVYALAVGGKLAEVNEYSRNYIGMEPGKDILQFFEDLEQWNTLAGNANQTKQALIRLKMKNGDVRRFLGSMTSVNYGQQTAYILWGVGAESIPTEVTAEESRAESKPLVGTLLTSISGEISAALNGIIGMSGVLLGEKITGRQTQYVKDMKKAAETLLSDVDNILDYAAISEGNIQIATVDIELGAFSRSIVAPMRFSARTKGLELVDEINIKSPEYVLADEARLKQVLINLLANAIKFTNAGRVEFFVKIEGGNIIFKISDTGTGVKPEETPLLFEAFGQVGEFKERGVKGIRLGLSKSKMLVDMMGGKIWLESEYGAGSHFYVTIPYMPGERSDNKNADAEEEFIFAPNANVLLVDDIQSNLTVTAGLLQLCGITADVAMSGMEAINLVSKKDYDIVFMDYMMPEMDGVEAMKRIRGLGNKYAELPVVALTAGADNETKDFLLEAGMDDYLSKPLEKKALFNVLKKWLPSIKREVAANRGISEQSSVYSEILQSVSFIDDVDIQLALSRISGMQKVLEKSLIQAAKSINGYLCEMNGHLSKNNLKDFSVAIHGMKGAMANIGAMRLSEMAAELEILSKSGDTEQCNLKFTKFADATSELAAKLNAIFNQEGNKNLPQGNREFLNQKTMAAVSFLERFEIGDARVCINEILNFTYGKSTDKMLSDARDSVAAANYKNAITILRNLD